MMYLNGQIGAVYMGGYYHSKAYLGNVLVWSSAKKTPGEVYAQLAFENTANGVVAILLPGDAAEALGMTASVMADSGTVVPGYVIDNGILSEEVVLVPTDAVSRELGISGDVLYTADGVSVQQVHEKKKAGNIPVILFIQQAPIHDVNTSLTKTAAADLGGKDIVLESTPGNSVDSHGATMSGVGDVGSYIGIYSTLVHYLEHIHQVEETVARPSSDQVADGRAPHSIQEHSIQGAADDVADTAHVWELHQHGMYGVADPVADTAHPWQLYETGALVSAYPIVDTKHDWKAHEHNAQGVASKDIASYMGHRANQYHVVALNTPTARSTGVFLDPFTAAIYSNVCALVVAPKVLQSLNIDSAVAPAIPDSTIGIDEQIIKSPSSAKLATPDAATSVGNKYVGIATHMHEHCHAGIGQHTEDRLSPVEQNTNITIVDHAALASYEQCVGVSSFLDAETILIEHVWAEYFWASDGRYGVDINRVYDIEVAESGSLIMTNDSAL